ncbi:cupin-like domain-containing protein [Sphingomonas sp.]|uniref:cupin-like domain-containing protein n=1 Tax=Sphingomonas sp. TaxID=28214 RepID=UPI0025E21809|nr:cupin-like domain-containing protein [Sphingomonas sp.]MBV9528781.1 cupin-like domain-containing protein [Sphingomonas sp.]
MLEQLKHADEIDGAGLASLPDERVRAGRPVVVRGAFRDWPIVREGLRSNEAAVAYLDGFYNGRPVSTIVAPHSEGGRFFYRPGSKQMNFQQSSQLVSNVLKGLLQQQGAEQPIAIAMQAVSAPDCLPGLEEDNPNALVPEGTRARVWIGNKVTVAPHFDVADNLACVVAGRRRFVLFPAEQTPNLYPGPIDVTPANVPISMVAMDRPDFDRFPRYREALDAALIAELEPGDAVYIPYMWWHGVQSLGAFNVLMNYWWHQDPLAAQHPYGALLHLAYSLFRPMSAEHRLAWRALYDHYVFQTGEDPVAAFPPGQQYRGRAVDAERIARLKEALRDILAE